MATWESFLRRRNLKARDFIERNSIKTVEEFLSKIQSIGLEEPPRSVLESLFTESKKTESMVIHETNGSHETENLEAETKIVKKPRSKHKNQSEVGE